MKTYMIILLVIFSILIAGGVEANEPKKKYLNLNRCSRPNPPPGCHQQPHKPRTPVHEYTRGCTKINRCRRHGP
ncbi:PREDICTED: protein RALF-like 25 [Camelina sativa]|uniref:Protein RALF-like 25 n=1 Tax=Camelina sativa TaxID=90675 RepID=A0ABM0Z216_CAMSA|nr:PREDICTED: protein RALF-like 25 [Camelina sativa]